MYTYIYVCIYVYTYMKILLRAVVPYQTHRPRGRDRLMYIHIYTYVYINILKYRYHLHTFIYMYIWMYTYIKTPLRAARYGVAAISRLLKIIVLFCKRALLKRLYFAKETYIFVYLYTDTTSSGALSASSIMRTRPSLQARTRGESWYVTNPPVSVCCSVLKCVAVCCSVLQYVAMCCNVLQ